MPKGDHPNSRKNLEKGKKFQKGQITNPKGQPPKTLTGFNRELAAAGYERVTMAAVAEAFEALLALDQEKLEEIVNDKKQVHSTRIIAKALLGGKGFDIIKEMLDRAHGKAKQTEQIEHSGRIITGFEFTTD